jgi:flagellar biosynthetic protein FlhB
VAEEDSGQERTEEATPKRQHEAREKGQIPRSRELNTMTMMLAASGGLLFLGGHILDGLQALLRHTLHVDRAQVFDTPGLPQFFSANVLSMLQTVAPFLLLMLVAALTAPLALGGWAFSGEALGFKWSKLDPLKGMGRVFSWRGLIELVKSLAKFALLGAVAVALLWQQADSFLGLSSEPLRPALRHAAHLLGWSFLALSSALVLIAAVDVPFQLWDNARQLKMTRQEIRDEMKETDGRPEVKAQIKRMQREMAQRRMMEEVPKADVIVTNPSHYAVALRYDATRMGAPRVVAKGADLIALKIRETGLEHNVAILGAPPLARALFFSTELNHEIPAGLYLAVAQVLAYVYQLRARGQQPVGEPLADLPIPDELRRD